MTQEELSCLLCCPITYLLVGFTLNQEQFSSLIDTFPSCNKDFLNTHIDLMS